MASKRIPRALRTLTTLLTPIITRSRDWCATNYMAMCRNNRRRQQVIAGCVCCAALTFFITLTRMQSATSSLGATTVVLVASQSIVPGDVITPILFSTRTLPRSAVAPTALHQLPAGSMAKQRITSGELLTTTNIGTESSTTLQLPVGFRSVAIVPPAALPPMQVGDRVDIIANGIVLAADALVLSLIENPTGVITGVIVAVPADVSAAVASAAAIGDATLVVSS